MSTSPAALQYALEARPDDATLVAGLLARVVEDLASVTGRSLELGARRVERATARPAGAGAIHISFKLAFTSEGRERHGALLVPLPEAIGLACLLLMIPDETITARRADTTLDVTTKDAILEIGNLIAGAMGFALPGLGLSAWSARSAGCQGVRPDVRPAFPYEEGSDLVVARVAAALPPFPASELILLLPPLAEDLVRASNVHHES